MYSQIPKQLIDTGEIGNASTGDILYDGGNKINDNMNALYNAFADQRLMDVANGTGQNGQVIHPSGYYQKGEPTDYLTPIKLGSLHDIDTTTGGLSLILEKGKLGESVEFINSNGSISVNNPLTIQALDSIAGVAGNLVVTSPYCHVVLRCISVEGGNAVWNYSIDSMFGQKQIPTDGTWSVGSTGAVTVDLFHKSEYNFAKLLVLCQSADGTKIKSAEINILINSVGNSVVSTEFSDMLVGNTSEADTIADITFSIRTSNMVSLTATSAITGLRVSVKVIATQKIGVAQ